MTVVRKRFRAGCLKFNWADGKDTFLDRGWRLNIWRSSGVGPSFQANQYALTQIS